MEKIPELYIYDKKPSSNPNDILKSAKNFYTRKINVQNCHCWFFSKTYLTKIDNVNLK